MKCHRRLLLLLSVLLLLPLTACREQTDTERLLSMWERDRAFAFYELIVEQASAADAYEIRAEMEYEITLQGNMHYRTALSGRDVCTAQNGDALTLLTEQTVHTEYGYASATQKEQYTYDYTEGYADGYMFCATTEDGISTAYQYPLTPEEYRAEFGSRAVGILPSVGYWACANATCRQIGDGAWEARYSGFTAEALGVIEYIYGIDFSAVSEYVYLHDAEVTVIADQDFRMTTVFVSLSYEEAEQYGTDYVVLPNVYYTLTFDEWNTATPATLSLEGYEDVGDLRIPERVVRGLDARMTAERGTYSYNVDQTTVADGETTERHYVTDMSFDTVEGAFSMEKTNRGTGFDGKAFHDGFRYQSGMSVDQTLDPVTGDVTYEKETPMTEAEARSVLSANVDLMDVYFEDVIRIETQDAAAGKYRLYLGGSMQKRFEETYADGGGELTVFEAYLDVTLRDGVLDAYTYTLHTGGRTRNAREQDNVYTVTYRFTE